MIIEAVRWNMLNAIRVELFFDIYKLWNIAISSNIQSQRGQYAMISFFITLIAQVAVQFNFTWLLTMYIFYLLIGLTIWLYRRVYFYHRKQDPRTLTKVLSDELVQQVSTTKSSNHNHKSNGSSSHNFMGTLKHFGERHSNNHQSSKDNGTNSTSSSTASSSSSSNNNPSHNLNSLPGGGPGSPITGAHNENTNSLQRQRLTAYRDFQSVLNEPRRNPKEFALSLAHFSRTAKLFASDEVFDEMHFQILATRRDVVNLVLRFVLIIMGTVLAYS